MKNNIVLSLLQMLLMLFFVEMRPKIKRLDNITAFCNIVSDG